MNPSQESGPGTAESQASASSTGRPATLQGVDWRDFRDHIATADQDGRRRWLHPKAPAGVWHRRRAGFAFLLIVLMFAGPWIRIQGNPLLLFNLVERRFSILGQIFWPQDSVVFAVAMLVFISGIVVFTVAFGRLWCGWACPQTVMMEMVFRKVEYLIDGDSAAQRALAAAPWTASKIARRLFKHGVFFGLSFVVGNTLLAYIIGSEQLLAIQFDDPRKHWAGLIAMTLFSLLFYAIFARFREQACTFICPYGRFQSALLDENSLVVAYDRPRGEQRAPLHRDQGPDVRNASGLGDCVDCRQCVAVCPTGIDIRDGTQMECVNCTACIDACDTIMHKVGQPIGLIRFASQNNLERGEPQRFTRRMALYSGVLAALVGVFLWLVLSRSAVETTFLRVSGSLYQTLPDGRIRNLYSVKMINKSHEPLPVEVRLENLPGSLRLMGATNPVVPVGNYLQTSALVDLDPAQLTGSTTELKLGVYSGGRRLERVETQFSGPRNASPKPNP
jgi:cytochrome c oxidase accessory protein FixG